MAVGYKYRIDGRWVDTKFFHIVEEDVAVGTGIEQEGMTGNFHQTGQSHVGRQDWLPDSIVLEAADYYG
jgi:hypothetical protein